MPQTTTNSTDQRVASEDEEFAYSLMAVFNVNVDAALIAQVICRGLVKKWQSMCKISEKISLSKKIKLILF